MSVAEQVEKTLSKILIERIVLYHHFSKQWKLESQIPKIRVEFVDINSILKRFKGEIEEMKKHFAVINEVYDIGGSFSFERIEPSSGAPFGGRWQ